MTFHCNLGARRCDLRYPLANARNGDEIVLEVVECHAGLAANIAVSLKQHLAAEGKQVSVSVRVLYQPTEDPQAVALRA